MMPTVQSAAAIVCACASMVAAAACHRTSTWRMWLPHFALGAVCLGMLTLPGVPPLAWAVATTLIGGAAVVDHVHTPGHRPRVRRPSRTHLAMIALDAIGMLFLLAQMGGHPGQGDIGHGAGGHPTTAVPGTLAMLTLTVWIISAVILLCSAPARPSATGPRSLPPVFSACSSGGMMASMVLMIV